MLQEELFSINNMRNMEVVDINTGRKIGLIKDFVIDCDEYKITSLVIPTQRVSWLAKDNDIEIPWNRITKIGVDVILVDAMDIVECDV
ncbi:MAG: YlmC/YmxH family sporulation protein [Clostridium sp.]